MRSCAAPFIGRRLRPTLCRMSVSAVPPSEATWNKTWLLLAFVAAGAAGLYWFLPDRDAEARACTAKCSPRPGLMVPDTQFAESFKREFNVGPMTCSCSVSNVKGSK